MEHVKLKSLSGIAKLAGVALCLAGILVIALYAGPSVSPVNHHRAFASHASSAAHVVTRSAWVKWTFLMVLANTRRGLSGSSSRSVCRRYSYLFLSAVHLVDGFLQQDVEAELVMRTNKLHTFV